MLLIKMRFMALAIPLVALAALSPAAQSAEQPIVQSEKDAKFVELPALPSCMTLSVYRGNPMDGPSLLLIKAATGCVVPWHWHTAREELMMVSGTGQIEMQGMPASPMTAGGYLLLPAKSHHQFTCQSSCVMFDALSDTFDIHYLDESGNEIPVEQALKAASETPGSNQ